jgi:hypothetical protein
MHHPRGYTGFLVGGTSPFGHQEGDAGAIWKKPSSTCR